MEANFITTLTEQIYFIYLSFLFCVLVLWTYFKANRESVSPKQALDLGLAGMIGGFIGARTLHVLFEEPEYYFNEHLLEILNFWNGGFVFYGGLFGGLLAGLILVIKRKLAPLDWLNFYSPILALGYGLGRIACLLAGCCYGRSCQLPWAIHHRHPTQLYATTWELAVFGLLTYLQTTRYKNKIFFVWMILHGTGRIVMESFRDDPRGNFIFNFSLGIWISLALICTGLCSFLICLFTKQKV